MPAFPLERTPVGSSSRSASTGFSIAGNLEGIFAQSWCVQDANSDRPFAMCALALRLSPAPRRAPLWRVLLQVVLGVAAKTQEEKSTWKEAWL
eukprot:Skav218717  [mRNA]  locus=scaffold1346:689352:690521:+ [translate_table: standard]